MSNMSNTGLLCPNAHNRDLVLGKLLTCWLGLVSFIFHGVRYQIDHLSEIFECTVKLVQLLSMGKDKKLDATTYF